MKHLKRVVIAAFAVIAAAVPAILADPSFAHYVAQHPWASMYLPLVSGVITAVVHAVKDANNGRAGTGK